MKITNLMASMMVLASATACSDQADQAPIIEKPQIEVVDGQFTIEMLEALGRVSDPQVSPDGSKILYGISYESIEQNKSNRELWVIDKEAGTNTRITHTPKSEQNAVWIDGGKRIAFLYPDDQGVMQIHTMNADGSNRSCASNVEKGIDCFLFSPDQTRVLFVSQVKSFQTAADHYPDLDKSTGRIYDDIMYKHWDEWTETIPHPFVAEFDGKSLGQAIDIMEGEPYEAPMKPFGGVESLAWTADSHSVIYVSRKKTGREYSISTNSDLYQYDIEAKTTRNLTEGMMGYDTNPTISPSGTKLAWLSMEHDGYESDKNRIFVMDLASGEKTDLTADWDYSVDAIAWSNDESAILFVAPYLGTEPMFSLDIATRKIDIIADGLCDYASVVPAPDGSVLTLRHSMNEPNEIYCVHTDKTVTAVTHVNDELLSQLKPITIEKRLIPTTDGKQMTTWVVYPPDFDPTKKYPAILYCQGGPQQALTQFWSYRWNFRIMASMGYIVIAPNRRGLPGFGTEWNAQISGDYGGQNMRDYLSAVDEMKKESFIDAEHIGAVGASYGGFSVYWLAGNHNGRFAALIAHAGIFNTESQYLETEEMWFANWDLGGPFWESDNAIAQRTYASSPHKFVQNWDAPILVTVGEKDYRILASQGMMAFNAACLRGVPSRLLIFPDENHWILKPQNAQMWQREFFAWLDRWLKPQPETTTNAE